MTEPGKLRETLAAARAGIRPNAAFEAAAVVALLAALIGAPLLVSTAALNDLGQAVLLGLFAIGFNIVFKYSGLLSFGHAAFFGFAAYVEAQLLQEFPAVPILLLVPAAAAAAALLGLVLGQLCLRRAGAYFSMTTLAMAAFLANIAYQWHAATGGTDGLDGFMPTPLIMLPGWRLSAPSIAQLYWIGVGFLIPATLLAWALLELTPFGDAVQRVRQNEQRAAALGYDTHRIKLANYALAAFVAGLAGALWAIVNGFVSTDSIDLTMSTTVIIMAFIGGTFWFFGPLLGSIIYVFGSDRLSALTEHWQLWMGLLFIAMVLVFPRGVAGLAVALAERLRRHV